MTLPSAGKLIYFLVFAAAIPASGIVIQDASSMIPNAMIDPISYLAPFDTVKSGVNLNGVVMVNTGLTCSGVMISSTQVLTAAHCMDGASPVVRFQDSSNNLVAYGSTSYVVDPDFIAFPSGADLAIVNLASAAPAFATIYQFFNGTYNLGDTITIAGFGDTGTGTSGYIDGSAGVRRVGENAYDTDSSTVGLNPPLVPPALVGDFDGGVINQIGGSGLTDEVDIAPGDSGGPSFYNGQLIGIHNFLGRNGGISTSQYGDYFGDTSIEANSAWLQSVITPEPSTALLCYLSLALIALLWGSPFRLRAGFYPAQATLSPSRVVSVTSCLTDSGAGASQTKSR